MEIILDADVIIFGEKGSFELTKWLASRPDDHFQIAAITVAELWHGVQRASRSHKARRQQYLEAILHVLPVLPYTEDTAYEHARIWADLSALGKMIGFYDLIVAATALERDCGLASFNRRHFSHVKGLRLLVPA